MDQPKKKILIVEDNAVQSMMIKRYVEELGYVAMPAVDRGEEAIATVTESHPDAIIMDIFLNGDMTGIEVMQVLRDKNINLPVIYVSGNSDPYYVRSAQKTNFSQFLFKPLKLSALKNALDRAFKTTKGQKKVQDTSAAKWVWPFSLFF